MRGREGGGSVGGAAPVTAAGTPHLSVSLLPAAQLHTLGRPSYASTLAGAVPLGPGPCPHPCLEAPSHFPPCLLRSLPRGPLPPASSEPQQYCVPSRGNSRLHPSSDRDPVSSSSKWLCRRQVLPTGQDLQEYPSSSSPPLSPSCCRCPGTCSWGGMTKDTGPGL